MRKTNNIQKYYGNRGYYKLYRGMDVYWAWRKHNFKNAPTTTIG